MSRSAPPPSIVGWWDDCGQCFAGEAAIRGVQRARLGKSNEKRENGTTIRCFAVKDSLI